jgi:hypothetical protein
MFRFSHISPTETYHLHPTYFFFQTSVSLQSHTAAPAAARLQLIRARILKAFRPYAASPGTPMQARTLDMEGDGTIGLMMRSRIENGLRKPVVPQPPTEGQYASPKLFSELASVTSREAGRAWVFAFALGGYRGVGRLPVRFLISQILGSL